MEGTIGEIRMFAGNFFPRNWAFCTGQILAIRSNTALFSILGTTYGGDGQNTFALPNLAGRCVVGSGSGPGLTPRIIGQSSGSANVTLLTPHMPSHTHPLLLKGGLNVSSDLGNVKSPSNGLSLAKGKYIVDQTDVPIVRFSNEGENVVVNKSNQSTGNATTQNAGGGSAHENRQPSIGMNFIICLYGTFPSRG